MGNKKYVTKMLPVTLEMKKPPARIRRLRELQIFLTAFMVSQATG